MATGKKKGEGASGGKVGQSKENRSGSKLDPSV